MTWKPDTTPLSGDEIRTWRMSLELSDEEYWAHLSKMRLCEHVTQKEAAARVGINKANYTRMERCGASGARAALMREHMNSGCDVSAFDAPLEWFEWLIDYCGTEAQAAALLGMQDTVHAYSRWIAAGHVSGVHGTGRLLAICVERYGLPCAERVRQVPRSARLKMSDVQKVLSMSRAGHSSREVARCVGVSHSTVQRYVRRFR